MTLVLCTVPVINFPTFSLLCLIPDSCETQHQLSSKKEKKRHFIVHACLYAYDLRILIGIKIKEGLIYKCRTVNIGYS